jgi:hypothetical protein
MCQPFNFPTPPLKSLREQIHEANPEELRALALHLLDQIERTREGRQCGLCAAPCAFVVRDS